jgi:hypothetical protein
VRDNITMKVDMTLLESYGKGHFINIIRVQCQMLRLLGRIC